MSTATENPGLLQFIAEDDCCAEALSKALVSGKLAPDAEKWTHKKCGCEWRSRLLPDGIVQWTPVVIIEIWR